MSYTDMGFCRIRATKPHPRSKTQIEAELLEPNPSRPSSRRLWVVLWRSPDPSGITNVVGVTLRRFVRRRGSKSCGQPRFFLVTNALMLDPELTPHNVPRL